MHKICIIGERGLVSNLIREKLTMVTSIDVTIVSTDDALHQTTNCIKVLANVDLVVVCVQDFQSAAIITQLPTNIAILDISPTYRCDPLWKYGLPELYGEDQVKRSLRVANPGCFATAGILLLKPILDANIIADDYDFYLDAVGGYSTGGAKLIDKFDSGGLSNETEYGLTRDHRHIDEIKYHCGISGEICFTPKIASFHRGIRMQTFIPMIDQNTLFETYCDYYAGTNIMVSGDLPSNISGDEWANKPGACIRVYNKGSGCLVVCTMDNLGKGAVDSAIENINIMLSRVVD